MNTSFVLLNVIAKLVIISCNENRQKRVFETTELPEPVIESNIYWISSMDHQESRTNDKPISAITLANVAKLKNERGRNNAIQIAAQQGLNSVMDLYLRKEPEILRKGEYLEIHHPASKLSLFSAPMTNESESGVKAAYANLFAAKKLQESLDFDFTGFGLGRQASKKISLRRTSLEASCPQRSQPQCLPATKRYRTHDGSCNNFRRPRWGQAQLPFHRFLSPAYSDGLEKIRTSATGEALPSPRFVSLVVHGYREEEAPITMLLPHWGQLLDHDLTSTLGQPSINGSVPSCCHSEDLHPACLPIQVPRDDPFLGNLGVRCLEFLRSAPAQRRDCFLSWREQTNQVTSFIDASPVYSSNARTADRSRVLRDGLLFFGKGPAREDTCLRGGFGTCLPRPGDTRASEQPGLLALHTVFVTEHNRISLEIAEFNPHWSDEKLYQETRRIIGAIFQHITYREFLPLVLGKEVCRLFDLEVGSSGYYTKYDAKMNPTVANAFAAAAFRFGHSLIPNSIMRSDLNYRFLMNNVSLHEENARGDIGGSGSFHRIIRGMATQRTLKRDEFMSPELTNHLFQTGTFPFGMDLAAINIQRGRDHGLPSYVNWRQPCGLSEIKSWEDLEVVAGPKSVQRMRRAYRSLEDIDLFVGGISERPVIGGLVGPTFACIIAQQFSNLRRGDRYWYENPDFESSFTSAQLFSIKQVTLSQILCRNLGNSNFIQPHAFLPPEFEGNGRLRCGSGILAPMNLSPWTERDPFNKDVDLIDLNLVQANNDNFLTVGPQNFDKFPLTSKRPVDLGNELQVLITARPTPLRTTIDNKLDFQFSTISTTRKPTVIIDNKLDFDKRHNSPFSKLEQDSKNAREVVSNDLTDKINTRTKDLTDRLADSLNVTRPLTEHVSLNEDTKNNSSDTPLDTDSKINKKLGLRKRSYYKDYEYEDRTYQPNYQYDYYLRPSSTYYTPYPPLNQMTTVKGPVKYQENIANPRPVNTPISNKHSTPFSYDNIGTGNVMSVSGFGKGKKPIYISLNRVNIRPLNQGRSEQTT